MTTKKGYLGIDNGTQGLSIIFADESLEVLATGEGIYDMVPGLDEGCYEQPVEDWELAMKEAMKQVKDSVPNLEVLAIGIAGQMHGEVLMDETGKVLGPVRLWCDARNEEEGKELTEKFDTKVPKRMTSARFLWTIRNRPDIAKKCKHMTTPAGWCSYRLTGKSTLGVGDASGMFPISQETMNYDINLLDRFDSIVKQEGHTSISSLKSILPEVCVAGQPAGYLNASGAQLLGLPEGIPVAPAEGDQPAALAGSLIGRAGTVSLSFGTSVCANSVGDRQFKGVSDAVDHFCAADGKPINMVWLRNGTTFMNTIVSSYGMAIANSGRLPVDPFSIIMPLLVDAPADCGGLLALPFMNDEAGVNVSRGGSAMIMGWNEKNSNPGNVAKAALMSTCFNLKRGSEVLDEQGFPRSELVLTGGLAKTPACAQILADIFNTPTTLLDSSHEGSAFGASLMAKFLHLKLSNQFKDGQDWPFFLDSVHEDGLKKHYNPISENVDACNGMYKRHKKLLDLVPSLIDAASVN